MVSLIDSQKERADPGVDPGLGRTGGFEVGGGRTLVTVRAGVEMRGLSFWEGRGTAGGRRELGVEAGIVVAVTMADSLSIFFSTSATRLGVCTAVLGLAGLLRATCSMQSTRAF
jgi:hypothetical protein